MANIHNQYSLNSASPDIDEQNHPSASSGECFYEIHVGGHLNCGWSQWLEGLDVKLLDNGEMILFGPIVDQAALMGLLNKLSRLNLTLLSVNKVNRRLQGEKNE